MSFISIKLPTFVYYLLAIYCCRRILKSSASLSLLHFLERLEQVLELILLEQVLEIDQLELYLIL